MLCYLNLNEPFREYIYLGRVMAIEYCLVVSSCIRMRVKMTLWDMMKSLFCSKFSQPHQLLAPIQYVQQ